MVLSQGPLTCSTACHMPVDPSAIDRSGCHTNFCLADIGRPIKTEKAVVACFKGYDACSLPLISLVEAIIRTTGVATFIAAVNEYFATCGVNVVRAQNVAAAAMQHQQS